MLEVKVAKTLGGFTIAMDFCCEERGITALCGPSGSGKTSLIKMLAGLLSPDRGRLAAGSAVFFDQAAGVNLPPERRRVGLVFQEPRLFPHYTVAGNLAYGLTLTPPEERRLDFERVVALLGIGHLLKRRPARLSGGEKQRVALGRALLTSPRLLLMDEPLASLDQARKDELLPFIAGLPGELAVPIVYVSHARREIERLADRVILVEAGRARGPLAPAEAWPAGGENGG